MQSPKQSHSTKEARLPDFGLETEAESHTKRSAGVVGAAGAAGVDITEGEAAGGMRRAQPPRARGAVKCLNSAGIICE